MAKSLNMALKHTSDQIDEIVKKENEPNATVPKAMVAPPVQVQTSPAEQNVITPNQQLLIPYEPNWDDTPDFDLQILNLKIQQIHPKFLWHQLIHLRQRHHQLLYRQHWLKIIL